MGKVGVNLFEGWIRACFWCPEKYEGVIYCEPIRLLNDSLCYQGGNNINIIMRYCVKNKGNKYFMNDKISNFFYQYFYQLFFYCGFLFLCW